MGLEWHDRARDRRGAFAALDRDMDYNLHLHIRSATYDRLRQMATQRRMEMSTLVESLIWRFDAEMKGTYGDGKGHLDGKCDGNMPVVRHGDTG